MAEFRQIDDRFYGQAGKAISAASDAGVVYPEYDNAELVAAAASVALERGAPRLIAQTYDIGADSYLKQGSQAWRKLHPAVARFVETDLNESEAIPSRGEGVRMVVADVIQAESARKVVMAAGNKDFEDMLNPEQTELMRMARNDQSFLRDLSSISIGSLDRLSPETAGSLKEALDAPIPGRLGQEVSLLSRAVDGIVDREEALDERLAGAEGVLGRFSEIPDELRERVQDFHRNGVSTGTKEIDSAMVLLSEMGKVPENLHPNDPIMIAQARLLHESMEGVSKSSSELASMALSDAQIMIEGRREYMMTEMMPGIDSDIRGQGQYHLLEERDQARIERDIVYGMKTAPIEKVRLEVMALETSGVAAIDRARVKQDEARIDPVLAEEVAKAAGAVMDRHPEDENHAFVQMGHALSDFHHGRRDDRSLVEAAEELAQSMDDRSMSGGKEWEGLSVAVDRALGRGDSETLSRAAHVAAFEAGAKKDPVEHEEQARLSRAQHMAAMNSGMGI